MIRQDSSVTKCEYRHVRRDAVLASDPNQILAMLECVPLLAVDDVDATASYYCEKLGFEVADVKSNRWVRLRRGAVIVEIEQCDAILPIGTFEKGGVVFRVVDVDGWCAELQRRGAEFDQGPMNQEYGRRDFSVIDPNGYRLCFWQSIEPEAKSEASGTTDPASS